MRQTFVHVSVQNIGSVVNPKIINIHSRW